MGLTAHVSGREPFQFAARLCILLSHCSAGWQQAGARGSEPQSQSNSPVSPWLEHQRLEHTKRFRCGKRGELAPAPRGNSSPFANAAVTEGLRCQLPLPTSQARDARKSLAAKHFQTIFLGNLRTNQATILTPHEGMGWEMQLSWPPVTLIKILLHSYRPISHVPPL